MIISKTPMRMSFIGGGSDLRSYYKYGYGAVISTSIDRYVYIMVNKKFADIYRVGYSKTEEKKSIDEIEHNLVRESLKMVGVKNPGIDIVYTSDMLPAHQGSGLGSSSSILVGTLHALYAYIGKYVSSKSLAEDACNIEVDILKNPIGKQDQYAASYGGFNFIKFNSNETVDVFPIVMSRNTMDELVDNIMVFYTGINTRSDSILTEQNKDNSKNKKIIDNMVLMTEAARDYLHMNDLNGFAQLLNKGWNSKKKLSNKISNSLIDRYYNKAINSGAIGGKILGSGGGGFLMIYCEPKYKDKVRDSLSNLKETKFNFDRQGSRIIYVDN